MQDVETTFASEQVPTGLTRISTISPVERPPTKCETGPGFGVIHVIPPSKLISQAETEGEGSQVNVILLSVVVQARFSAGLIISSSMMIVNVSVVQSLVVSSTIMVSSPSIIPSSTGVMTTETDVCPAGMVTEEGSPL